MRTVNRSSGYSLAELLVVLVILAFVAAIAIPIFLSQRDAAVNTAIRADLGVAASAINTRLLSWGGTPPDGDLAICHTSTSFPTDPMPENSCPDGRWETTIAATGLALTPALDGTLGSSVRIQGFIDADGDFCLEGSSDDTASTYFVTSGDDTVLPGTCAGGSWVQASPSPSATVTTAAPVPGAPSGVYVTTTTSSATVHWDAVDGETYAISLSGQPTRTVTATATEQMTCLFPAATCDAVSASGTLSAGSYTAQVRRQGTDAWGPATRAEFGIPVTVTATPTVTVTVTETPTASPTETSTPTPSPSPS